MVLTSRLVTHSGKKNSSTAAAFILIQFSAGANKAIDLITYEKQKLETTQMRRGGGRDDSVAAARPELRCLRCSNLFRLDMAAECASSALAHVPRERKYARGRQ